MYVLTEKEKNIVVFISETLNHQDNGNPLINNDSVAVGFPVNEYSNITIPDGVEPQKYCFDGTTFTSNEDYVEPPETLEQKLSSLEQSNYLFQQAMLAHLEDLT